MNITKLKAMSLLPLIDVHLQLPDSHPSKHELDCIIISKMNTVQDCICVYFCSLGDSALEEIALMRLKQILETLPEEGPDAAFYQELPGYLRKKIDKAMGVLDYV